MDSMATMTVVQARSKFGDLLARAAYSNERTLVTRNGKPVAAIVSARDLQALQALEDAKDVQDALAALEEVHETGVTHPLSAIAEEFALPLTQRARTRKAARSSRRKR
jgi:prevent-host-death family protein